MEEHINKPEPWQELLNPESPNTHCTCELLLICGPDLISHHYQVVEFSVQ